MILAIYLLLSATLSTPADTVRLSLRDAVTRARESNLTLVAERADVVAAVQTPLDASRAFLPTLRLDANGIRTTDPVAVFGLKLRHENFQAEDLGLEPLNRPAAYGGYSTTATIELPLFAPGGLWQYGAARQGARAREVGLDRLEEATTFGVARAYWDAQLAMAEVQAMQGALTAAQAHLASANALREQGVVTGLDARLARLRVAELEARIIAGEAKAQNNISTLAVLVGLDQTTTIEFESTIDDAAPSTCVESSCDLAARSDLVAGRLGVDAARLAKRAAFASNLPSVAVFGTVSHYARSSPWGNGSGDWTVGVGLTWSPFRALSGLAAVRRARAQHEAAEARFEAAQQQAALDVLNAERMLGAAVQQVAVARAAQEEAVVALEQARLRYATGTAPVTEFLDVQSASVDAELRFLTAQHGQALARAALDFAYGAFER